MEDDDGGGSSCDCTDEHAIVCYGCGVCYHESLSKHNALLKSKGERIVTSDYNTGETIIDYDMYGELRWFCPVCDSAMKKGFMQSLEKKKDAALVNNESPSRKTDLLEKLNAETVEMKATLDRVAAHLDGRTDSTASPKRKSARFAWKDDDIDPILTMFPSDNSKAPKSVQPLNQKHSSYSDMVKLNIKTTNNVLKNLHDNRHLVSGMSTRKKKSDGSIDVLFKNFDEAEKAKSLLEEKLGNDAVGHPSPDGLKRYHLVGLNI